MIITDTNILYFYYFSCNKIYHFNNLYAIIIIFYVYIKYTYIRTMRPRSVNDHPEQYSGIFESVSELTNMLHCFSIYIVICLLYLYHS